MSLNSMGLGFVFTARDLASGAIQRLERNFLGLNRSVGFGADRMQVAFRALGAGIGAMTAGAASLGSALALARGAAEFEMNIAAVGAVAGATSAELTQLRTAAIQAGLATQFSPTEAALGLRELAAAGFRAHEATQLLLPVLDLAGGSLGELSPQAAAGLAAQAIHSFGLEMRDASMAVDQMLFTANAFAVSAGELPLAMGIVSRGAQTLRQSLPETLAAWGLVKNIIPTVERSSTAVSVAMERMATPGTQRALRGIGIEVQDAAGRFRPFLDVLGELAPRLEQMTEVDRARFLQGTFGRQALGGVSAILSQITHGIETQSGEVLLGAAAIAHLRGEFDAAKGSAARFRDQLLATFAGQSQLLRGSLETLVIAIGTPMAELLRPVVSAAVDALNGVLDVIRSVPAPVLRALSGLVLVAGAFSTLVGSAVTAAAGIALLGAALEPIAVAVGGVLALLGPAAVGLSALGLVASGFASAFRRNLGGIGDFVGNVGRRVSLAFRGVLQLFEQGGFSGVVLKELDRAENQGVRRFAVAVFRFAHRVQRAWDGLQAGFSSALDAMAPTFRELRAALTELGAVLGDSFGSLFGNANALPSDRFRAFGKSVGFALAGMVRWTADALTASARFTTGVLTGVRAVWRFVQPAVDALSSAFAGLGDAWSSATAGAERGAVSWGSVGRVLGGVLGGTLRLAITQLAGFVHLVSGVVHAFAAFRAAATGFAGSIGSGVRAAVALVTALGQRVVTFFEGIAASVRSAFASGLASITQLVQRVPSVLLPEALRGLSQPSLSPERPVARRAESSVVPTAASRHASVLPAAAAATGQSAMLAALGAQLAALTTGRRDLGQPPIQVQLQVDGRTLAEATRRADRDAAARSFSSVPTY